MTANFATISNVLHTVINSDFFLGNRHNQIIIDPFIYATKDQKLSPYSKPVSNAIFST